MPSVSVIVPSYNYARYLKERIRSILKQTTQDYDLLIVDDASSDECPRILEEYQGVDRVTIQAYSNNSGGVYNRRNEIAASAKGEWLWFAEADDSAHPEFLETLLNLTRQQPNAAVVHCRLAIIDEAGRLVSDSVDWDEPTKIHLSADYSAKGYEEAVKLTSGCFFASSSGLLINRAAFLDVGGYDSRLKMAGDWDLYVRLMCKYDSIYTEKPLAYYRTHKASVTKTVAGVLHTMEDAYCVMNAYGRLMHDPRISESDKSLMAHRLRGRLFDMFVAKKSEMLPSHRFVLERLQEVAPDPRAEACLAAIKQAA